MFRVGVWLRVASSYAGLRGASRVRHLGALASICIGSSLLWISISCSNASNLRQSTEPNLTASASCAVTTPNGRHNPGETPSCAERTSPTGFHGNHGNGQLWVGLPNESKLLVSPEKDGSLRWKFPWWRAVCGHLTISGRRLDAPAGPLRGEVPSGYGQAGFQASGVYFPSEGCWEVTGRAGDAELTFVVEVRSKR